MNTATTTCNAAVAGVFAVALTHPLDTLTIHRQTNRRIQFTPTVLYRGGLPPALFQAAIIYGVGWVGCSARVDGQRAIGSAQELEADQLCPAPRSLCTLALSCCQYCWCVDARNSSLFGHVACRH